MKHPSSLDLEAFACGETVASVGSHLGECTTCTAFVERLKGALSAGPSRAAAADAVARASRRAALDVPHAAPREAATPASAAARRRWFMTASTVAVPLAAAAALLVLLRTPSTRDVLVPTPSATVTAEPTGTGVADPDPETTFKGGIQVAVIRERAGQQTRFTGNVQVRPGDRIRVEVALDREQAILAAVLGDDASWLELMTEGVRRPGTHFSERSARVDSAPMRGAILVGSPEAVMQAKTTKRFEGVSVVRVEWETP